VVIVIYPFAHGFSATHMADQFNVGASTTKKYVDIVCNVVIDKSKLFSIHITIHLGQCLKDIIACFENFTCTPNICGAIHGIHIPLANLLSKKVTLATSGFFNRKKFHSIALQVVCDVDKIFWNICVSQPRGVHDGGQFKRCSLYAQLRFWEILQKPVVTTQGMKCTPFLISDATYPICTYL
jgi:hypothetical protein